MVIPILILTLALVALLASADFFVDTVIEVAERFQVSTMVVGLTVVAIGTSLPELAASIAAAIHGHSEIALGNVLGSNICNIALIIGLPALFLAITCDEVVLKKEGVLMISVSFLFWVICAVFNEVPRIFGVAFVLGFGFYLYWVVTRFQKGSKKFYDVIADEPSSEAGNAVDVELLDVEAGSSALALFGKIAGSLLVLLISSEFLIRSTVEIAQMLHVSEAVIALSIIALGTSLPELSVSFAALKRRESDIIVGNILGSNISNILLVIGTAATIQAVPVPKLSLAIDFPIMAMLAVMLVFFLMQKRGVTRLKGMFFLVMYALIIGRCLMLPGYNAAY